MTSHAHAPAKADPTAGDSKSRGEAAPANPLWSRLTLGSGAVVQPKLRLGAVDDPAEREADRVAEAVVQRKEGGRDTVGAGLRPALLMSASGAERGGSGSSPWKATRHHPESPAS